MAKKVLNIISKIVVAVVTALCVLLCAYCVYVAVQRARGNDLPTVFGYTSATVATGSMEPTISVGDLVIIKSCESYAEDDIVTYYDSSFGGYITHRIIEIDGSTIITKGDANDVQDGGITALQIVGKVVCVIGGAGTVINFLQTPAGIMCIVGVVAAVWLIVEIVKIVLKKDKKEAEPQ